MLFGLGIGIVILAAVIMFRSPFNGLLVYWTWFLVRPQEFIDGLGGTLPLERFLALAALGSLIYHFKMTRRKPFYGNPVNRRLLALLATAYLSLVVSIWQSNTLTIANDLGKLVIFYFLIINLIDSDVKVSKFMWVFFWGVLWIASSSIWNYETNPYYAQGIQRATSLSATWQDPNATAINCVLGIPVLFFLMKRYRRWWIRVTLMGGLALISYAIVLTGSRTGMILLAIALVIIALRSPKRLVVLPLAAVALCLIWLATPEVYQHRYLNALNTTDNIADSADDSAYLSAHGRIIGLNVAWQIFLDHPVLGVGAGNFAAAFGDPKTPYNYQGKKGWSQPHNLVGQIISELGLLGLLAFGSFVHGILRVAKSARLAGQSTNNVTVLALSDAIFVSVLLLFVAGFSSHDLYRFNWYVIAGLAAVSLRLAKCRSEHTTEPDIIATGTPDEAQFAMLAT